MKGVIELKWKCINPKHGNKHMSNPGPYMASNHKVNYKQINYKGATTTVSILERRVLTSYL